MSASAQPATRAITTLPSLPSHSPSRYQISETQDAYTLIHEAAWSSESTRPTPTIAFLLPDGTLLLEEAERDAGWVSRSPSRRATRTLWSRPTSKWPSRLRGPLNPSAAGEHGRRRPDDDFTQRMGTALEQRGSHRCGCRGCRRARTPSRSAPRRAAVSTTISSSARRSTTSFVDIAG